MTKVFVVNLPWPPSQNHSIMPGRGNRPIVHTKTARQWLATAHAIVHEVYGGLASMFMTEKVSVRIDLYPPHHQGDIDGTLKKILDACQSQDGIGGAYHNDRQIRHLEIDYHDDNYDDPFVTVHVWEHGTQLQEVFY